MPCWLLRNSRVPKVLKNGQIRKDMRSISEKLQLKEYYQSLPEKKLVSPRIELVEILAKKCQVKNPAIYNWLKRGVPDKHIPMVNSIIEIHKESRGEK